MTDIQVEITWEEGTTKEQAIAWAKEIVSASGYEVGGFEEDADVSRAEDDRAITGLLEAEDALYEDAGDCYEETMRGVVLRFEKP